MTYLQAIIIAIVEGITEFLPISSTAHMVITSAFMKISEDAFTKYYEVCIQLGAILSVLILYFKRFIRFSQPEFYIKLIIAVIPSLLFGKLMNDVIDNILGKPGIIAIVMIAGGFILLGADRWFRSPVIHHADDIDRKTSFRIGLFQCLAILFPGLSRSAATIIGGMMVNVSRAAAAEFSFFLAVPTMFAATAYKTYTYLKSEGSFTPHQTGLLITGNAIAFIVALLAIRFFIGFVKEKGFALFGYYRILAGIVVLALLYSSWM
ncbi:MAG TPA: undecaprenyl-diphosphate phosphatase [Chitinophagaceae bacterium]|nr:undecaprenyl-diphosphate phosphatase [Chitinophagaceae bacterium]HNF71234.1 undecaprenyl-diphosphate phosphatase [Chitinophagaceae bacterium]